MSHRPPRAPRSLRLPCFVPAPVVAALALALAVAAPPDDYPHLRMGNSNWAAEDRRHGADEKKTVQRYKDLLQTLKDNLSGAKVYKVGDVNRDIYIVGKIPAGDWAGGQTKAVET